MKNAFIVQLIVAAAFVAGCGTVKKVEKIEEAINKKDTAQTVIVPKVDSIQLSKDILKKIVDKRIDFTTFSAKVRVEFQDQDDHENGTAYIRMSKDSLIWISLTGPLGVEVYRVLIQKNKVSLWNKLNKTIQYRTLAELSSITQIPLDFSTLQDLIVGNPIFLDSNVVSYKVKESETLILMIGDLFKHLITLDNTDYKVMHSKLDDVDAIRNRTMSVQFTDYQQKDGYWFPTKRNISVAENNTLEVSLDFKQYVFNPQQTYPFNPPKNVKVK